MNPALAALLHNPLVWRGDQLAPAADAVCSGFPELDRELPGGGWPKKALTELLHDAQGIGELRLLLPAFERLARCGETIVLVAPPHIPYAPAFVACGIEPARLFVVAAATEGKDRWWAAEQVLRADSAGALLFWPGNLGDHFSDQRLRRLQLAAQDSDTLAFLFAGTAGAAQASPSPLRLTLAAEKGRLRIDVFKRRGGVMVRPLLLDVSARSTAAARHPPALALTGGVSTGIERLAAIRTVSFRPRYPVGGPSALIWNRALARADEGRRGSRPDPREGASRVHAHEAIVEHSAGHFVNV
ncbi:MAG: translesion DNA synthesis-associated protein ImuA [Betaproteobacteria bacterium]